jgi:hypothetical protein
MLAASLNATAQSNPISTDAKQDYPSIKDILLKSAVKMPQENYSFRTTPRVRTFGEMIAHVADVRTAMCTAARGEGTRRQS